MRRAAAQIGHAILGLFGAALCAASGLAIAPARAVGQDDSASVGPPPHFVAAWAPPGTMIDVSRMGVLRERVSLDLTDVPVRQAIATIRDQAKLNLVYEQSVVPADKVVSIHAKDIMVSSALAEALIDLGLDVVMTRSGQLALVECTHVRARVAGRDGGVVEGRVVDRATRVPLAGAVVTVDSTRLAVTANSDGRYRIAGLSAGVHTLTAKFIGYSAMTATVSAGTQATVQEFALEPSPRQLDQVVVTGTLVPTEIKAIPTPITVITADDIRRQNVMRMDQLFRGQAAGVLAQDLASFDYYTVLNIRGANSLNFHPVKTFIDGIEVANAQFIALIDPNSIERIELTRGPEASAIYGSDAVGGALQIFTKKGKFGLSRPEGEVKASVGILEKTDGSGAAARLESAVTLRGGEQRTRYNVAGYYRHDGEWTPSYRNTNWSMTASAENIQGPLTSRISALFARKTLDRSWYTVLRDSGYAFFSKPPYQTIDVQSQTYGANFVYVVKPWWRHDLVLGYDRSAFELFQTKRRLTTSDDTLLQVTMNQRSKMSIFYHTTANTKLGSSADATLTVGFNHYSIHESGTSSPATTSVTGTLDGPAAITRTPSTNTGYFAQARFDVADAMFLTAGLRAEKNSSFGDNVGINLSPRLGIAFVHPVGGTTVKLRLAYGESIRPPEPYQKEAGSDANFERLANPMLRPERLRGVDGGVDLYWGSQASLSTTYYHQNAVDLIDQVLLGMGGDPPRQQNQNENVGSIRNSGWEIDARYNLEKLRLRISGTFAITRSAITQLSAGAASGYRIGDRILGALSGSGGTTVDYSPFAGTAVRLNMTYVSNWVERDYIAFAAVVFGSAPARPADRDYWITYPGFTKFGLGFEQKISKRVSGAVDVDNLMNNRAFDQINLDVASPRTLTFILRALY